MRCSDSAVGAQAKRGSVLPTTTRSVASNDVRLGIGCARERHGVRGLSAKEGGGGLDAALFVDFPCTRVARSTDVDTGHALEIEIAEFASWGLQLYL